MEEQAPEPQRPYRLLRGLLSAWLLSWLLIILAFLYAQFDTPHLFAWPVAIGWFAIMAGGWLFVFFLLRRLQKMPPE